MNKIENPYIQYMYSYPHKTAYEKLSGQNARDYVHRLLGQENSLYVHIPFCQCKCGYCNLFSIAGAKEETMERYVDTVLRQMEQYQNVLPKEVSFSDLTYGGGTPLILSETLFEQLTAAVRSAFSFLPDAPFLVETSPNQTTKEKLQMLKRLGVTRISIGIQSLVEEELCTLRRVHSKAQAEKALSEIKKMDFETLNVDVIYGIPGQTRASLSKTVQALLEYEPEEFFVYPLYVKPGTPLWKSGCQRSEEAYSQYLFLQEKLAVAGYRQDSMRRFVKKERPADITVKSNRRRNRSCGFQNTLALGAGGRSYLGNLHFCTPYQVEPEKCQKELNAFLSKEDLLEISFGIFLDEEEQKRRYVIKHLLYGNGICLKEYESHFHKKATDDFPLLLEFEKEGYACRKEGQLGLTFLGRSFSDALGTQLISEKIKKRMEAYEV